MPIRSLWSSVSFWKFSSRIRLLCSWAAISATSFKASVEIEHLQVYYPQIKNKTVCLFVLVKHLFIWEQAHLCNLHSLCAVGRNVYTDAPGWVCSAWVSGWASVGRCWVVSSTPSVAQTPYTLSPTSLHALWLSQALLTPHHASAGSLWTPEDMKATTSRHKLWIGVCDKIKMWWDFLSRSKAVSRYWHDGVWGWN